MQRDYENTYWNNKGLLQSLSTELGMLVPTEGECRADRPKLERFREASNLYYDLYNNGGCNYGREIGSLFGPGLRAFNESRGAPGTQRYADDIKTANEFIKHVDRKMDKIILEAYHEKQTCGDNPTEVEDPAKVNA